MTLCVKTAREGEAKDQLDRRPVPPEMSAAFAESSWWSRSRDGGGDRDLHLGARPLALPLPLLRLLLLHLLPPLPRLTPSPQCCRIRPCAAGVVRAVPVPVPARVFVVPRSVFLATGAVVRTFLSFCSLVMGACSSSFGVNPKDGSFASARFSFCSYVLFQREPTFWRWIPKNSKN